MKIFFIFLQISIKETKLFQPEKGGRPQLSLFIERADNAIMQEFLLIVKAKLSRPVNLL
jgi:hypothetical protein